MLLFKRKELEEEFQASPLKSDLRFIVYAVAGWFDFLGLGNIVVTDIWRNDPNSVHHFWRGIDIVPEDRDENKMNLIRDFINEHFQYDAARPKKDVVPNIHHGTAPHDHLQSPSLRMLQFRLKL